MLKHTLTAAAVAALLTAPALAQQPQKPAPDAMNKQTQSAPNGTMSKPNESLKNDSLKGDMAATANQQSGFIHAQEANEWRASTLIGASVYGPDNKSIGDINELLIEKDGRVTAVVVGVGGFLGVGEKRVALPLQSLNVERKDGEIEKITVAHTKEQLNNAPTFAYYKDGQAATTGMKVNEKAGSAMMPDKADSKMMPDRQNEQKK
jgi:sporulation protein YlmC with PRC-barrel domain